VITLKLTMKCLTIKITTWELFVTLWNYNAMSDTYEFEIHYGEIEEPLYLTNDKDYICDEMSDYIEELGIELNEIIYKVKSIWK